MSVCLLRESSRCKQQAKNSSLIHSQKFKRAVQCSFMPLFDLPIKQARIIFTSSIANDRFNFAFWKKSRFLLKTIFLASAEGSSRCMQRDFFRNIYRTSPRSESFRGEQKKKTKKSARHESNNVEYFMCSIKIDRHDDKMCFDFYCTLGELWLWVVRGTAQLHLVSSNNISCGDWRMTRENI